MRAMVAGVVRTGLAKTVIDAVVQRTDGVPLFAEELTRLLLEEPAPRGGARDSSTLHDSLTARLGRLGRAKEVAQLGAVLRRDYSYEVLRAMSPLPGRRCNGASQAGRREAPARARHAAANELPVQACLIRTPRTRRARAPAAICTVASRRP
jgi:predicted ATPase